MSYVLRLELDDTVFSRIQDEATAMGIEPTRVVMLLLEQSLGIRSPEADAGPSKRFEEHFGEVSFGYALGADNESIDADLAAEYGRGLPEV